MIRNHPRPDCSVLAEIAQDHVWCVTNGLLEDTPDARGAFLAGYVAMKVLLHQRTWRRDGAKRRASRTGSVMRRRATPHATADEPTSDCS